MRGYCLSNDLKPITNAFRAGRLVVIVLFSLFMLVMILGLIAQAFRPDSTSHGRTDSTVRGGR